MLINYGRRSDSYALGQLYLAETLSGDSAARFRQWALQDLVAYAKYCYDEKSRAFYEMRRTDTGERIRFSQVRVVPTSDYFSHPMRFQANKGLPLLFLAYARGYKLTSDERLKETAIKCLDILELERGKPATLSRLASEFLKSDMAACLIQGLLDLYEAEGDAWYLEAARGVADDALSHFFTGEFFVDWPNEFRSSRVNQSLPLALLRLYAVCNKRQVALPQDIGGYGMSVNNPNDISMYSGAYRFMWAKHHVDIGAGNLSARVGDSSPHGERADDLSN